MPPECGCSQDSTSESITGKWAGLLLFLFNPVSPTISHATAEYTPRRYIVNKKLEDLQVFLSSRNCRILGGGNEAGNEGFWAPMDGGRRLWRSGIQLVQHPRKWNRFPNM